ncbi:response regulator [Hymenobacter metallicola]|uniref:Response regulator n=1 Tax=Hymenobacter metallicola TaxID=2563114 RepID=A0A4Z0QDD8_9BACT|nr:response regulator [Hymenobacter metallicola]TGE27001.1 response regulator [Hymenobacter metallicola]
MPASIPHLPPFEPALRVLVVDDNELNQLVVCRALEDWNVEATLADNGRQAVELVIAQPFDVVLMDIQMPEMDGYEATRRLRSHSHLQLLPIIGLTASASAQDQAQALQAGMNTTLAKPFDPALLHANLVHYTTQRSTKSAQPSQAGSSTPEPATEPEIIIQPDWTLLEELAAGNESFIAQLVTTFLEQTPLLYQQLVAACTAGEELALARLAHKLKGQVVYFGVPAMEYHLEKLERPSTVSDSALPLHRVEKIGQQLAALYPYLQHRLDRFQPK